jgi:hypothetical protein
MEEISRQGDFSVAPVERRSASIKRQIETTGLTIASIYRGAPRTSCSLRLA